MTRVTGIEMAEKFSNFVNSSFGSERIEFAREISSDHRTLQEDSFLTFLMCIEKWASDYDNGSYDERNKYTVKASKVMLEALKEAKMF